MEIILKPFILQIVLSGWNDHSKKIKSKYSCIIYSVLIMPKICLITAIKCGGNNNNNNSNFFFANILENQAQWRNKTRGLINLIIESNA